MWSRMRRREESHIRAIPVDFRSDSPRLAQPWSHITNSSKIDDDTEDMKDVWLPSSLQIIEGLSEEPGLGGIGKRVKQDAHCL